jgi:hypothetical protein
VTLSALVLVLSPAAPDPAHAICDTGYEPQRSGVRGNKPPAHFTIEEIHRIPSRSNCSLESHKLVKQLVCLHSGSAHAHLPFHAFVGSYHLLRACSDIVQSCYFLRTLFQVVPLAANPFAPFAASVGSLLIALLRPPHPASGIIGHFWPLHSRHVVPQSGNASTHLPNQPQLGTTFIAASGCQASARPLPLLAFLLPLPSLPSPCRTTRQSSPCSTVLTHCEPCIRGKHHRDPFPQHASHRATLFLARIHSGFCPWLHFIDDCSWYLWINLLRKKSETFDAFTQFKAMPTQRIWRK